MKRAPGRRRRLLGVLVLLLLPPPLLGGAGARGGVVMVGLGAAAGGAAGGGLGVQPGVAALWRRSLVGGGPAPRPPEKALRPIGLERSGKAGWKRRHRP